jgi:8-amino-7-oxononanoate synthase
MNAYLQHLAEGLEQRRQQSLYRQPRVVESPSGPVVRIGDRQLLAFCSNDYLGLAAHPALRDAFINCARQWGVGSGSAHLVTGHSRVHQQLEEDIAAFTGFPRALLFSSGYMANLALLSGLVDRNDHVFADKLNHASLIDSGQLCQASMHRYLHADIGSLQRQLGTVAGGNRFVVTDGVFSMDGDLAPLKEMAFMAEDQELVLMVDDAHGIGVLGRNGRGSLEHFSLKPKKVPMLMGTLGKALGTAGAFIAADEVVIETLIQKARSYIYTTAQPAAVAAAASAALRLVDEESWRREKLHEMIRRFTSGARQLGLPMMHSQTAIQPLLAGSAETAVRWAGELEARGILVTAIRPPTVPEGTARLRITLSAAHTDEQVDQLLDVLQSVCLGAVQ